MSSRPAEKAGSWYEKEADDLASTLDKYLARVPESIDGRSLPIPGARIIIAPHAGYEYSGPNAAWAYKCLDLSKAKRVFILGPSHTLWFQGCAVTTFSSFSTPFGDLIVDQDVTERVKAAGEMDDMPTRNDVAEHSLEMHLPYLYKRCQQTFKSSEEFPKIVPIVVGDTNRDEEKDIGRVLVSYLKDPENAFIISSDFCHWGSRFDYTIYSPEGDIKKLTKLRASGSKPTGPPIYETIELVDKAAMDAVETGSHDAFVDNLKQTRNTVCGRHPIGVAMAALELYAKEVEDKDMSIFKVVRYNRSSEVEWPDDSSVSYVSAYAIL